MGKTLSSSLPEPGNGNLDSTAKKRVRKDVLPLYVVLPGSKPRSLAGRNTLAQQRQSYLESLTAHQEFLTLQGLTPLHGDQRLSIRLADIFVPLHVEQARPGITPRAGLFAHHAVADGGGALPTMTAEGLRPPPPRGVRLNPRLELRRHARTMDIPALLRARRAMVLGEAGAGKTTLLRYVACTLAQAQTAEQLSDQRPTFAELGDCLPVYLHLGEYGEYLQDTPDRSLDAFALVSCQGRRLPLPETLLKSMLAQGRVLFLLDSFHEIIASGQRRAMAQRLVQFARTYPACRMLITSRWEGYHEAYWEGEFAQFTLCPLSEADVHQFAQQWSTALGRPDHAPSLRQTLQASPTSHRLTASPWWLVMLALAQESGLPAVQQRTTLYRHLTTTLIEQGMRQRGLRPGDWDPHEVLRVFLPTLAWHLHHTKSSGVIEHDELHHLLIETLQRDEIGVNGAEAVAHAVQFLHHISACSGIFVCRGLRHKTHRVYGFLHPTFEEYFAALYLADQWQRHGHSVLQPRVHDPHWTEAICLAAGHLGGYSQYEATRFVHAILDTDSPYEDILHRNLLIALRCLAEEIRIDTAVQRTLVSRLLTTYFATSSSPTLRDSIGVACARLHRTGVGAELSQALTQHLGNRRRHLRWDAASLLGQLGPTATTPATRVTLLQYLAGTDKELRQVAAEILAQLGPTAVTPATHIALLRALNDAEVRVRRAAAQALGQLGSAVATPATGNALLHGLTDPEGEVRQVAAWAIGQLGAGAVTPATHTALLQALTDTEGRVRWAVAQTLGQLGSAITTPETEAMLLQYLTEGDRGVARAAAEALGQLGAGVVTPATGATLCHYLNAADWRARQAAARALGQLGAAVATPGTGTALLQALADPDEDVRQAVAEALGQLGTAIATPAMGAALLEVLADPDRGVRQAAARALGQLGAAVATPITGTALLQALADPDADVRWAVVLTLGQMGQAVLTPTTHATLLQYLASADNGIRQTAAEALGLLGPQAVSPEAYAILLQTLTDADSGVRRTAARALGQLGPALATPTAHATLLQALADADEDVRWAAVRALGQMGPVVATPVTFAAIRQCLSDPMPDVRRIAAETLAGLAGYVGPHDRSAVARLLEPLTHSRDVEGRDIGYVSLRNLLADAPVCPPAAVEDRLSTPWRQGVSASPVPSSTGRG